MTLSPAVQKIAALGLLAAVGTALWVFVVSPLQARFQSYDASITRSQTMMARYGRIIDSRDQLQSSLKRLEGSRVIKQGFFGGRSPELAVAPIQAMVKDAIGKTGSKLISVQVLPAENEKEFQRIGIRVRMSGDVDAFGQVLYALETAWPLLFTDRVNVRVQSRRQRRGREDTVAIEDLRIQFDVYGYFRPDSAEKDRQAKK